MFSKSIIAAAAVFLGLSLQVHAHAGVTPALGVAGTFARSDVQRPSNAKPCGNIDVASNLDSSTAITAAADGSFTAMVTNFNGGVDGSRQVTVKVDSTGTGESFVAATVSQNGDKSPKSTGSQKVTAQLPQGLTCKGGASGNKCLVSFTTAGGFGNCAVVQTGTGASNNAAVAAGSANANANTTTPGAGRNRNAKAAAAAAAAAKQKQARDSNAVNRPGLLLRVFGVRGIRLGWTRLPALLQQRWQTPTLVVLWVPILAVPVYKTMSQVPHVEWPGLPQEVHSRTLAVRDLEMHFFEAGSPVAPLTLLLHGFPELAYSWRKIILPLAREGYRVVAPDLRGFGRTKPRDPIAPAATRPLQFEDDVRPFQTLSVVHDIVALVSALGHTEVRCLIGHDAGSTIAGFCCVVRPELFKSVVFMSTPFTGPPPLPFDVAHHLAESVTPPIFPATLVEGALAVLDPPRKHYMLYYSTPSANTDLMGAAQGLHALFRGYYHAKSAEWEGNDPHPIEASAAGLASLPHYYVMPRGATMADVAAEAIPSAEVVARSAWLPDSELAVYAREYGRTGFQGGLNRYRVMTDPALAEELTLFAGKEIEMPAKYISGRKDWGVYQNPGALDKMKGLAGLERGTFPSIVLLDGAGHWVQQEQPVELVHHISQFLRATSLPPE
ncbi:Alpha/Beta hydrolase protein [Trametes elegans]|nr:Alpha/Beta hydrolase protein [Trametes elegans]